MIDESQINAIVREVLGTLRQDANGASSTAATAPDRACGDLTLSERVVTLSVLEGRLDDTRRVVVDSRAIVTPAASDELRERNIELARDNAEPRRARPSAATASTPTSLVIASADRTQATAAATAVGAKATIVSTTNAISLVGEFCRPVSASNDARGVLLTEQPMAAHCLANRHRHIRAASVVDQATVFEAASTIGANVFIVDTRCVRGLQVNQIVEAVLTSEIERCPAELRNALEQSR